MKRSTICLCSRESGTWNAPKKRSSNNGAIAMTARSIRTITAGAFVIATSAQVMWLTRTAGAQTNRETTWRGRTPWGDPDLHGEWTTEGEYGVPFERPAQFGTRQFLNDEEYGRRLDDIRVRDD